MGNHGCASVWHYPRNEKRRRGLTAMPAFFFQTSELGDCAPSVSKHDLKRGGSLARGAPDQDARQMNLNALPGGHEQPSPWETGGKDRISDQIPAGGRNREYVLRGRTAGSRAPAGRGGGTGRRSGGAVGVGGRRRYQQGQIRLGSGKQQIGPGIPGNVGIDRIRHRGGGLGWRSGQNRRLRRPCPGRSRGDDHRLRRFRDRGRRWDRSVARSGRIRRVRDGRSCRVRRGRVRRIRDGRIRWVRRGSVRWVRSGSIRWIRGRGIRRVRCGRIRRIRRGGIRGSRGVCFDGTGPGNDLGRDEDGAAQGASSRSGMPILGLGGGLVFRRIINNGGSIIFMPAFTQGIHGQEP